jgi:hypothetical protein
MSSTSVNDIYVAGTVRLRQQRIKAGSDCLDIVGVYGEKMPCYPALEDHLVDTRPFGSPALQAQVQG